MTEALLGAPRIKRATPSTAHWTHVASVGLYTLSVVATLVAVALFFWPAHESVRQAVGTELHAQMPSDSVLRTANSVDTLSTLVVSGNVFSATRRAPSMRFMPPGRSLGGESVDAMRPTEGLSAASTTASDVELSATPVLSGIVVQDGERRALLQLTASDDVPRLYREGDTRNGFRIVRIGVDHVVISSGGTSRTYRLVSPPPSPPAPATSPVPSPSEYL